MDVISVTEKDDAESYKKVVIMLHGGGMTNDMWIKRTNHGWFGDDLTGFKYVYPTSAFEGHVWYDSIKAPNCSFCDDCAYEMDTIVEAGQNIRELIEHEISLKNLEYKDVFLGGFSQGAQMAAYV